MRKRKPRTTGWYIPPKSSEPDAVNHPSHYQARGVEVIDVIEAFGLGFHEGNVVKYLLRWRRKDGLQDLKKAQWYLDRFIKTLGQT